MRHADGHDSTVTVLLYALNMRVFSSYLGVNKHAAVNGRSLRNPNAETPKKDINSIKCSDNLLLLKSLGKRFLRTKRNLMRSMVKQFRKQTA
jgi:hypothetical protein